MKKLITGVLLVFWGIGAFSQSFISLNHTRKNKQIFFQTGEIIRYQVKNDPGIYSGVLRGFDESYLYLGLNDSLEAGADFVALSTRATRVPIDTLAAILNPGLSSWHKIRRTSATVLAGAGTSFILVASIQTLTEGHTPNPTSHLMAAGALATAFVLRYGCGEKCRLGKRWDLAFYPEESQLYPAEQNTGSSSK